MHCKGCNRWPVIHVKADGSKKNISCICLEGYT
jgi:hypothetical protein